MEQGCTGSETDSEDCLGLERRRRRERREERSPISPARTTSTKREKGKRRPEREARGGREGSPSFFFPLRSPPPPPPLHPLGVNLPHSVEAICRRNLARPRKGEEWRKEGRKGETLESSSSSSSDPPPTHFCQQMKGHPPPSPTSPLP